MRSKILLLAVILLVAFSAVELSAENVGDDPVVTKVFDMSRYGYEMSVEPGMHYALHWADYGFMGEEQADPIDFFEDMVTDIKRCIARLSWGRENNLIETLNGRIIVRNRKSVVAEVERWLQKALPRCPIYDVRLSVYERAGYDLQGVEGLSGSSREDAAKELARRGYSRTTSFPVSLAPFSVKLSSNFRHVKYIGDFEGLIATFSTTLDPVMYELALGQDYVFHIRETRTGVVLSVAFVDQRLRQMRQHKIQGSALELPDLQYCERKISFALPEPGACADYSYSNETSKILLVDVQWKRGEK